jgi:hypothetical protein
MSISNDVLSSTLRILLDEEVDQLFRATPLLKMMKEKGGIETYDGGQKLDVPLILEEHSSITQLSSGYEPVNLAVKDSLRNASFEWCDFVAPIVLTRSEELSNKGERAIVSILEARMKSVMGSLQREVEKQLVANSSTILTNLLSLNGHNGTNAGGATTGFLEDGAVGAQTNTVGGLSKATFERLNNQYATSGGTLSIADMTNLYISCQINSPNGRGPDLIICSQDYFATYKGLIQANNERYIDDSVLDAGRLSLMFSGAALHVDPFLGSTVQNGAGTDPTGDSIIGAYFLNTDYIKLAFDSAAQFEMDDFEHVSGYASRSANIYTRMQIYFTHLASQGLHVNP